MKPSLPVMDENEAHTGHHVLIIFKGARDYIGSLYEYATGPHGVSVDVGVFNSYHTNTRQYESVYCQDVWGNLFKENIKDREYNTEKDHAFCLPVSEKTAFKILGFLNSCVSSNVGFDTSSIILSAIPTKVKKVIPSILKGLFSDVETSEIPSSATGVRIAVLVLRVAYEDRKYSALGQKIFTTNSRSISPTKLSEIILPHARPVSLSMYKHGKLTIL